MKVLITGGTGFFGSFLVPYLQKNNVDIDIYDIKNGDDLFDSKKLISRMKGCDVVLHLAAIPHYNPKFSEEDFQKLNTKGTDNVANCCVKSGVKRMIQMSSGACYGFEERIFKPTKFPFTAEDTPYDNMDKLNAYGRSKINAEQLLEKKYAKKLDIIVLRVNWIQGRRCSRKHHFYTFCEPDTLNRVILNSLSTDKVKGFEIFNCLDKETTINTEEFVKSEFPDVPSTVKGNESLAYVGNTIEKLGL